MSRIMSLIKFVLLLFVQKHYLQKAVTVTLQMITAKLVLAAAVVTSGLFARRTHVDHHRWSWSFWSRLDKNRKSDSDSVRLSFATQNQLSYEAPTRLAQHTRRK